MAKSVKTPKAKPKATKPVKAAKTKVVKTKTVKPKPVRASARKPAGSPPAPPLALPLALGASSAVLDRLWAVVEGRRGANPAVSHSARLLSRGTAKIAQKFGEEAVECLIEAVAGRPEALVAESADVLYHLLVLWVDAGVRPDQVWAELQRREGISGVAEKASRARKLPISVGLRTTKIP